MEHNRKLDSQLVIDTNYFTDIERAIAYNSSSTDGYAKKKLKLILNAFLKGKSVLIEDISVELNSIEEYKEWKKDRKLLNIYNSDNLIKEIEFCESRNIKW